MQQELQIQVEIFIQPDGNGFHAFCPSLKGLHVDGDNEDEALKSAKDAVIAYMMSLIKHGDPIPLTVIANPEEFCLQGLTKHTEKISIPACSCE